MSKTVKLCVDCLNEMQIEKVFGYYSQGSRVKIYVDKMMCTKRKSKWHRTLIKLKKEQSKTVSPRLSELISKDIEDILFMHRETTCEMIEEFQNTGTTSRYTETSYEE